MSTLTTNYKLVKPELSDAADITAMNENWDKLDTEVKKKADLGDDGKVPSSQLPSLNYIPTTEKAANNGVATLDENGQVPASQLGNAASSPTGAASTIMDSNLTANRALISNGSGKVAVSPVNSTELAYLDGVTSNVQTQLNGKVSDTGDTLTGVLIFNNKDVYGAIEKYRTINGVDRHIDVGVGNVGGDGCVALQYMEGSANTVLGRLEIGRRGVSFYDENGNRTFLYRNAAVSASVES